MLNTFLKKLIFVLVSTISLSIFPASWNPNTHDWDSEKYDFAYADFNNDGNYDILFIAKDPNSVSGILSWDDSSNDVCLPSDNCLTVLQLWNSDYLGIMWHSETFMPHTGDFNGDGRVDLLLDNNADGANHVLLQKASGAIDAISHTIVDNALGLDWGSSHLVLGDFNGDSRTDIYLQPENNQTSNHVVFANSSGNFTAIGDTWAAMHLGLPWSQEKVLISTLDYDGNKKDDLHVQSKTRTVMIPYKNYDVPIKKVGGIDATVNANNVGKFSEGRLFTEEDARRRDKPGGKGHCVRVPQLCSSR